MNSERSNNGFVLPLKGSLAPAELNNPNKQQANGAATSNIEEPKEQPNNSIPRDYIHNDQFEGHHHKPRTNSMARVTELLHRTVDASSPPTSPSSSGLHLNRMASPMSSSDSLASLIERQNTCKINHPSHQYQLFNNSRSPFHTHQRRISSNSIFNIWNSSSSVSHKRTTSSTSSTVPQVKSPLHNEYGDLVTSRKLAPNASNPHHIHSSPSVKESKKVYLEYDPVSRRKVLNTYEIIKEIGRGEHGKVKLAKDIYTEELVAIKVVDRTTRPKLGRSLKPGSTEEEKVRREIAIMKKINHPNVVQLKEVLDDTNSRKIYLVLEYLQKGEIKWQKAPNVPLLTLPEAMKVFRDVVLGLEYLHYQGIIHRDIKPANLLISSNGDVKISDFGVSFASSLKTGEQDDFDLAKTAGTPAFLAPELCLPLTTFNDDNVEHPKITYKIDIWALGITLYCLLFGSMPFWATNEFELFKVISTTALEFPETYPTNFEWTEEDKYEARNLLKKVLDKNPTTRITLKQIKKHPLVLRNLSVEEARAFSEDQKSCEQKIEVSNDEVKVAVTGIASRIRKGFAKALKMAGIGKSYTTGITSASSTTSIEPPRSPSDSRSVLNQTDSTRGTLIDVRRTLSTGSRHQRVNSGDAAETRTTVEGDLFLNNGSAFSSLSHIMNDDKRRASITSFQANPKYDGATPTTNSSSMSDYTTSNDSSFSKPGSQLVSLPVNASFASLDSVYLDSFAPAYVNVQDSRRPQHHKEVFQKMSDFSLNKSAEKKIDDDIAPHDSPATFDLLASDTDDADEEDEDESVDYDDEDDGFGFFVKPKASIDSNDQASELSVPSALAGDLIPSMGQLDIEDPRIKQPHNPPQSQPSISTLRQPITGPKYSFFENSDSESDEDIDTTTNSEMDPPYLIEADSEQSEDDSEDESDEDKLVFSFGNRGRQRHNTITALPFKRPVSEPNAPQQAREPLIRSKTQNVERITSPLGKNAPHTPISSSNAHLLAHLNGLKKSDFVNHYKRIAPQIPHHLVEDTSRGRANSVTVAILSHDSPGHKRASSQPI